MATLEALEARCKERSQSVDRRLDTLERGQGALMEIATSVGIIAAKQGEIAEDVKELKEANEVDKKELCARIGSLEKAPWENWKKLLWLIIAAVVGGVIGHFI